MKRNGYIDVIKFIFAIIIAEFHFNTGLFPGGRVAVEGFFIITGFLMMRSIEKSKQSTPQLLGSSTSRFMLGKYKGLLSTLFVSTLLAFIVRACVLYSVDSAIYKFPLLIFDIFPLNTAGFQGEYVVGISWYLSSMFIALGILYPLIKKFNSNFVLPVCPLIVFLGYGLLSAKYGNLAVGAFFMENSILHTGIIRALAGCSAGCLLFELSKRISGLQFTKFARITFTVLEVLLFTALFYIMHHLPKSQYDYVLIVVIFAMLFIGVNGLSYSTVLWNPKYTKFFGTSSMLIVLNHYCWMTLIRYKLTMLTQTEKVLVYVALIIVACIVVYFLSKLLSYLFGKLFNKKNWIKEQPVNDEK